MFFAGAWSSGLATSKLSTQHLKCLHLRSLWISKESGRTGVKYNVSQFQSRLLVQRNGLTSTVHPFGQGWRSHLKASKPDGYIKAKYIRGYSERSKYLGLDFDRYVSWTSYMDLLCSKLSIQLGLLWGFSSLIHIFF